ncbi:MAG: tRNA (adenosine(37)-N6)-dimethylallyltransferase MiaA [Syntrophomonadaceae bacterium]|nr:tRNA (adenosine(37)-N6)-dimethylallyltransferase MiaA [Syntrophomonadaceae bacterium]
MNKLAAIVGPTAVGKTRIAIDVAKRLNAEIISCDSMQIYRGLDIGTAKASPEEQNGIVHHLIDVVEPDDEYSVARFQEQAKSIIQELNQKERLPLLVGGTGLYYQALVDDYTFYPLESHQKIRRQWNTIIKEKGLEYAYNYLQSIDPDYAATISLNDQKRIVRAIEVYQLTDQPFSALQTKSQHTYQLAVVGLYLEREQLYQRINLRVEQMLTGGLIKEVTLLRDKGYNLNHNSMQALGYKQVFCYLEGFLSEKEMIDEIKRETRRYAKRQLTWFRKDSRIHWINPGEYSNETLLLENISSYIEGRLTAV